MKLPRPHRGKKSPALSDAVGIEAISVLQPPWFHLSFARARPRIPSAPPVPSPCASHAPCINTGTHNRKAPCRPTLPAAN